MPQQGVFVGLPKPQFLRFQGIVTDAPLADQCYDNAVPEVFFARCRREFIHTRLWPGLKTVTKETFDWVTEYYNRTRRHSTLAYLTPAEYELGYRNIHAELAA
jgi:putative transposase